jgi:hypothetical protein
MLQLVLDDFTWQRPASRKKGFRWGGTAQDPCLIRAPGAELKAYRPHPGIFRDFARCQQTPEEVLDFANRYGALCQRLEWNTFAFWRQGLQQMKELVTLSDAVIVGDAKTIAKALEPFLAARFLVDAAELRPIRQKQKRREKVSPNELAHAALMRLYHAISPIERLKADGSWDPVNGQVTLCFKHADLLDFMFFQLGYQVLGGRRFQQCTACGKSVLLQPGVNRADRITCSNYCRLLLYRKRRKAEELHRRGWSLRKIAQEIGWKESKVRQWLSQAQE